MSEKYVAVLLTLLINIAAGNAFAMEGHHHERKGHDMGMMDCNNCMNGNGPNMRMDAGGMAGRFMMMAERLELNADQKKSMEAIHFGHHKEVIRKEADLEVAEIELREIMAKEPVNVEEAEKQIRTIAALRADLEVMHMKTKEAIKAKLTPEQAEKMKRHMAGHMDMMEGMGDMGMADCKMDPKSKKCRPIKDGSGKTKAPQAPSPGKTGKVEEKKSEPSHQH